MEIKKFTLGKSYFTRSICDHECVYQIKIISRTEKTLKTEDGKVLRIRVRDGIETVKPFGTYSMCPVITAEKLLH